MSKISISSNDISTITINDLIELKEYHQKHKIQHGLKMKVSNLENLIESIDLHLQTQKYRNKENVEFVDDIDNNINIENILTPYEKKINSLSKSVFYIVDQTIFHTQLILN